MRQPSGTDARRCEAVSCGVRAAGAEALAFVATSFFALPTEAFMSRRQLSLKLRNNHPLVRNQPATAESQKFWHL